MLVLKRTLKTYLRFLICGKLEFFLIPLEPKPTVHSDATWIVRWLKGRRTTHLWRKKKVQQELGLVV